MLGVVFDFSNVSLMAQLFRLQIPDGFNAHTAKGYQI